MWTSVYQKTNNLAIGGLAQTLFQWIPGSYSPCQLLLIMYRPQQNYHKKKNLHAFMKASLWSSWMKPHTLLLPVQCTWGFCKYWIHIQTFSINLPGKSFRAPKLGPIPAFPGNMSQWFPLQGGMFLKQSFHCYKRLCCAGLYFLTLNCPYTVFKLECHCFQTNSLLQSSLFN